MKIRVKIAGSYIIIIAAIIFLSLFTIVKNKQSLDAVTFLRQKISLSKDDMNGVKYDIVQIQQWLSDVSATGYSDGFSEAEKYYKDAVSLLDRDLKRKETVGRSDLLSQLQAIKSLLGKYYSTGTRMAQEYVKHGRPAGNVWMEKFDPIAEQLTVLVDKQVEIRNKVFYEEFNTLSRDQKDINEAIVVISIIILLVSILIGVHVFVSFKKGSQLLENYSRRLAAHDISPVPVHKRNDEFGEMSDSFTGSFKSLNSLIVGLKSTTDETAAVKDSLVASAEETAAVIGTIRNNISILLKKTENMKSNVSENVASVEEITANINSIDKQIVEQAAMVEESTASIIEMISSLDSVNKITKKKIEAVVNLVKALEDGNRASADTDEVFQREVTERIDDISEMAEVIQSIVSQTNLLSMNAAIEAAHAGDAGKGFAVVADEIRKLADNAAQSSANISKTIKDIEEGIINTGKVAEGKVEAFRIMNIEIEETKNAFSEISSSIQEVALGGDQIQKAMVVLQDVSETIRAATSEITKGSQHVAESQLALKDLSDRVAGGMQEMETGSNEIVIAADEMVEHSTHLDTIVDELKAETEKFTL